MFSRQHLMSSLLALAILGSLMLSACGGSTTAGAPTEVTYTFPTFATLNDSDVQAVQNAINAIIKPKINATIKLNPQAFGTFSEKEPLALSSGDQCDIVFTAPWVNNYYQAVTNKVFAPLDTLLPKDAPELYASLPAATWNAAKVNGHIYAVINQQIFVKPWGVLVRKDLATKYNFDISTVKSYADLTAFYAQIKAGEPNVVPLFTDSNSASATYNAETAGWDPLTSSLPLAIKATDTSRQIFSIVDQPEFQALITQQYQWAQAGYTTKTPAAAADEAAVLKAGKYASIIADIKPGGDASFKANTGYDWVQASVTKPILTTDSTVATLNGVCASSPHPDKAVQVLNQLNTNKDVFNLISHGIEGTHYTFADKANGVITASTTNKGYNPGTDWMFGNQFNGYYTDASQVGTYAATLQLNQTATPSTALGFAFDSTPVKTQIAQVTAVGSQYYTPLRNGLIDPATGIPAYQQALKQAGLDAIKAEMQKQLDAWAKANGK